MDLKIMFFDFEVFKQDWFVSFLDNDTLEWTTIRSNRTKLIEFIFKNKDNTCFVGYNNKMFDNYCIKCIYYNINPWRVVDWVIEKGFNPWQLPELQYKKNIPGLITYDVMIESKGNISLKEAEGNLGMSIEEMNFDIQFGGKLKDEDYQKLLDYNKHDVLATKKVFEAQNSFVSKKALIDYYKLPKTDLIKTYPGIIGNILNAKTIPQLQNFKYTKPKCIELKDTEIIDKFEQHEFSIKNLREDFQFIKRIQGNECTFALGGLHGGLEKFKFNTNDNEVIVCADVSSLYPNLMVNDTNKEFKFYSRSIRKPELLSEIKQERLKYKKLGMDDLATGLKLGINSIYGCTLQFVNGKPTLLTDWIQGRNVCITGQLSLWMLAEQVSDIPTTQIFNLNTDGIYLTIDKGYLDKLNEIFEVWQKALGLELEIEIIEHGKVIQKDVNNYILYNESKGKIKTKGKDAKNYNGGNYLQNSASIIDEAVVRYFIEGKPVSETIVEAFEKQEAIKFQLILARKGKNFTETYWGDKVVQKVNRVFPSTNARWDTITKLKNGTKYHFPDAPEHCYVYNGELSGIKLGEIQLDLNYYLEQAQKRIERYSK